MLWYDSWKVDNLYFKVSIQPNSDCVILWIILMLQVCESAFMFFFSSDGRGLIEIVLKQISVIIICVALYSWHDGSTRRHVAALVTMRSRADSAQLCWKRLVWWNHTISCRNIESIRQIEELRTPIKNQNHRTFLKWKFGVTAFLVHVYLKQFSIHPL